MIASNRSNHEIDRYFRATVALKGTCFILRVGDPPLVEVDGIRKSMNREPISAVEIESLVLPILGDSRLNELKESGELKIARLVEQSGQHHRFDVDFYVHDGSVALTATPNVD